MPSIPPPKQKPRHLACQRYSCWLDCIARYEGLHRRLPRRMPGVMAYFVSAVNQPRTVATLP